MDNRLTFGFDRAVWTLAAKVDDVAPWHKGVLQGAEKIMTSWHKEEAEASRRRATKRDIRDLELPTHLKVGVGNGLTGANPAVNTPRSSRSTRI